MADRWLAIVNAHAGGFRHGHLGHGFLKALGSRVAEVAVLDDPADAAKVAADAHDYTGLVGVGGDGTLGAVLGGMDRARQRFAVVPAGTGNCLARDLGVQDVDRALAAINEGRPLGLDLMEARVVMTGGRELSIWLGSTVGIGYPAAVAALAKRRLARLRGHAYSAAALLVLPRYEDIEISINDLPAKRERLTGLLVGNTRYIGSARVFPAAVLDDGRLELMAFRSGWALQNAHNLMLMTGLGGVGSARPRPITSVHLRCGQLGAAMLDGEVLKGVAAMTITCRPRAVICMAAT